MAPNDMVVIDLPDVSKIKIPSGNEMGANKLWVPGGLTSGGVPEVTLNLPAIETLKITPLFGG